MRTQLTLGRKTLPPLQPARDHHLQQLVRRPVPEPGSSCLLGHTQTLSYQSRNLSNRVYRRAAELLRPFAVGVGLRFGLPPAGSHNAAVDRLQGEDQEVDVPRQGDQCVTAEDGDGYRGQPDSHVEQVTLDLLTRYRQLICTKSKRTAQRVCPQVHEHEHELDGDE